MRTRYFWLRPLGLVALCAGLSACANMTQIPPGTPYAAVQADYGRPDFTCPRPEGGERAIWTQQPMGQYAWATNVDASGRIDRVEAILTDEHFQKLGVGTWTAEQVRCEFGPPAEISQVGLPSVRQVVWAYRYRENSSWNSLMYVYLGRDGKQVTRFHPGPDPMHEEREHTLW